MKTLLVIDTHALIHRSYHALPDLRDSSGRLVNAVYGFTSVLIKVLRELKPDFVVAAFDLPGATFRHEAHEAYKATRAKVDTELSEQFPIVREVLAAFGIPVLEQEGFEADDIIGTIVGELSAKGGKEKNLKIVITTGDLDALQLVEGSRVVVYTLRKGITDTVTYTEKEVAERFGGLKPGQLVDFKGLKGDPSDNIAGVAGIGEKTAIELLKKYSSIEKLYEKFEADAELKEGTKKKLRGRRDEAIFSRELATIRRDVPIHFSLKDAEFTFTVRPILKELLQKLEFSSLLKRLEKEEDFKESAETQPTFEGGLPAGKAGGATEEYFRKKIFSKKIYELEKALTPVLRRMEKTGFLIEPQILDSLNRKINQELLEIKKKVTKLAREEFNLNSPQEVGRVVFDKLKLGGARVKKTATGAVTTRAEELEKLRAKHPIIPLLLRWRELSKLQSTYLEALPRLVNPKDGRIHTTFKQFGAVTGRLASESPNLQNIPIKGELGMELRQAFVARPGFTLLVADYSQVELRIAASLSGDEKLIGAFKRGEDIHTRTAAEVFNVPFDKVTKDMRRTAKILNFGVLYGMGARSFSAAAGVGQDEAQNFIEEYQADFAELTKFVEELKARAYSAGYAETVWGRRRLLPELASPNPGMRAAGERMAVNMPIQGTSADVIKSAMVGIDKEIAASKDIFMILQVHDELVFEVKKYKIDEYAPKIKKIMESVIELSVPLIVELETGPNWGQLEKLT